MQQAVTAFLNRESEDPRDILAQRALRAFETLKELIANAYNRGHSAGFNDCQQACNSALYAFVAVNTRKSYAFADQVDPAVAPLTAHMQDMPAVDEAAAALLEQADAIIGHYKDELTPVCTMSGVTSVRILRGDHCLGLIADLTPANSNLAA